MAGGVVEGIVGVPCDGAGGALCVEVAGACGGTSLGGVAGAACVEVFGFTLGLAVVGEANVDVSGVVVVVVEVVYVTSPDAGAFCAYILPFFM